eukprot:COSAG02_NODE_328_length_24547_cov_4.124141_2_plen_43_part_00
MGYALALLCVPCLLAFNTSRRLIVQRDGGVCRVTVDHTVPVL